MRATNLQLQNKKGTGDYQIKVESRTEKRSTLVEIEREREMFKSRLQELCQREHWALPEYDTTRDGPDHDPRFQSTVSLRGLSFHGPSGLRSAKEAQSEAACLAFRHFSQQASPLPPPHASSYKQKLQEVCQKKHLCLPKYEIAKDGPDHMPRFRATVYAGGLTFEGPALCPSVKDAQGQAARIAFDHFSGIEESLPSVESGSPQAGANNLANDGMPTRNEVLEVALDNATDPGRQSVKQVCILESEIPCKNHLQNYAQKRKLNSPSYDHVREGSIQNLRYKAGVTIGSQTFESQQFFSSLKEAENAAAKVVLDSLLTDSDNEDDTVFYKNLLLELIKKEGLPAAVFETVREGPSHSPLFISTVEAGSKKFKGISAKTKKQAEQNAAKVAWLALKKCSPQAGANNLANDGIPTRNEVLKVALDNARDPGRQSIKQVCILESEIPCKNQLQNYAQKRKLKLPSYDHVREGSIHNFRYKARVTIGSQTFDSQRFFSSLKDAESAAAKVALDSLLTNSDNEDDLVFYKNLLLELIKKEGLPAAVFETVREGPSHSPLFISTVETGCKKFEGISAKTKKQAEQNAAKVAWLALKECDVQRCTSADLPIYIDKCPEGKASNSQAPEVAIPLPNCLDAGHLTTSFANMVIEHKSVSEQSKSPGKPYSSTSDSHPGSAGNVGADIPMARDCLRSCSKIHVYKRRNALNLPKGSRVLAVDDERWVAVQVDPPSV